MSEKVYEQSRTIRAKKAAFYESQIYNSTGTPTIAVVRPIITEKGIKCTVKSIDLSKEYILGFSKNEK